MLMLLWVGIPIVVAVMYGLWTSASRDEFTDVRRREHAMDIMKDWSQ